MATTTKQTATEFHDEFIRLHGGPPVEIEPSEWLLADGARVANRGQPTYIQPPEHDYDRWKLRYRYLILRITPYDAAVRSLSAIIESDASAAAGANIISTHTFRWDTAALGAAPTNANPRVALAAVQTRRLKLNKLLAALLEEPAAEIVLPLIHNPNRTR